VVYSNPAQEQRLNEHPQPGIKFPKPMEPEVATPAKVPATAGIER
jgi:hypothetical protein